MLEHGAAASDCCWTPSSHAVLVIASLLLQLQTQLPLCCADSETSELETLQLAMTNTGPGKKKRGDLSALEKAEAEHEARQKQGASQHIWATLCIVAMPTGRRHSPGPESLQ